MRNWLLLVAVAAIGCSSDPTPGRTPTTTSSTGGSGGSGGATGGGSGSGGATTGGKGGSTGGSGGASGGGGGAGGATGGSAGKSGSGGVSGSGGAAGNTGGTSGKSGAAGSAPDAGGGTGGATVDAGVRPDAAADEAAACNAFADAFCTKLQSCSSFVLSVLYGDLATCKQRFALSCTPSFAAPGTSSSPARTNSCAQAIPALACSDFLLTKFGSACLPAAGTLAQGTACGDDAQCASTFCARSPTSACGTCQPTTNEGAACVDGSCSVSSGTVCSGPAGSMSCVKPAAGQIGDACIGQEQCDVGHQVGCNTATTKKCLALTLSTGTCGANNVLNPTSVAVCGNGGTCTGPYAGSCTPAAADGASCMTGDTGAHCMQPAKCIGGKCVIPDPFTCR